MPSNAYQGSAAVQKKKVQIIKKARLKITGHIYFIFVASLLSCLIVSSSSKFIWPNLLNVSVSENKESDHVLE